MTISRSNIPKQITTGGRKMMKKKGYRMGGKIKSKGMKNGGKVKVMSIAQIRAAANKKGYKLVKK
jgi:hypothetical protein|tara:strand:- start:242 stop:436 length:195 start_codon:yes stop_codon:yes gene_type:complete